MEPAVERILLAQKQKEKVLIYGDYDVDGITSTSMLYLFLKSLHMDVSFFIPDRIEDGYGLSIGAIDKALAHHPKLLITVDCGIVSYHEVEYVKSLNVDIIITDHHTLNETLPRAIAAINPHRPDNTYPYPELCGAGVTFKLIQAMCQRLPSKDAFLDYLDLVAIGTIADVVPLTGENRIFVAKGLEVISHTKSPGLQALIQICGLQDKPLTSHNIAFQIAPRLNAAGRLGDPSRGVHLFTTSDIVQAQDVALALHQENKLRQETETQILEQALFQIESDPAYAQEPVLVVYGNGWHHGVIGIVSSRITERYYKPSLVLSLMDGNAKGSARSIPEFNIYEALKSASTALEKFGGHKMAAGFSLKEENIPLLRQRINDYAQSVLTPYDLTPKIRIDAPLSLDEISMDEVKTLDRLEPFGQENPKPLFCGYGFPVGDIRLVGANKHLKMQFVQNHKSFDAIGFGMGEMGDLLQKGQILDLAFQPEINVWNQIEKVQFVLKDLRPNKDSILSTEYYKSLNILFKNALPAFSEEKETAHASMDSYPIVKELLAFLDQVDGKPTYVLSNSLLATQTFLQTMTKANRMENKDYILSYHHLPEQWEAPLILLVNPYYENLLPHLPSHILLLGPLFSTPGLWTLLNKVLPHQIYRYLMPESQNFYEDMRIHREDVGRIYQYLTMTGHKKIHILNLKNFYEEVRTKLNTKFSSFKILKILEILDQLDIIHCKQGESCPMVLDIIPQTEKKDLHHSQIFLQFSHLKIVNGGL
jgi:single-stranded-DNA-specific exonuclease